MDMTNFKSNIFINQDRIITGNDLCECLVKYIEYGTDLYIEFNLTSFGMLHPDIKTRDQLASIIFSILYEVSGPDATIIIPSFTFSWGKDSNGIYDLKSATHLGLLPNWLLKQKETVRTIDPMYSFLIKGKKSKWYSEYCNNSFGSCSLFKKLHDRNAKLIGFGLNQYDPTFIHYVEQYFDENISPIGYRYLERFTGEIKNNNTLLEINSHQSFVRNLELSGGFDYSNLTNDLLDQNLLFCEIFFGAKICISDCESVFKTSMLGLHKDLNYFMKKNDE